jgi:hypothetical protein
MGGSGKGYASERSRLTTLPPMLLGRKVEAHHVVLGGLFVVSLASAVRLLRPFSAASIGPDAAAPVIEFQRIIAGQRLEGHLSQTSKPLLTAIYGILYSLANDWRPVAWAAIIAFALCVVLGAILAGRLAGPASGAFVAVALLLSPELAMDVSLAYAVSWAVLFWLIAGLAVSGSRHRYAVAGVALALGALARPEGLAITGFALAVLVIVDVVTRVRGKEHPPASAYFIALGLLAIPVFAVHDWLITGDPLFWVNAAKANSAGGNTRDLLGMIESFIVHFRNRPQLSILAVLGLVGLLLRGKWAAATGVTAAVLGMSAFFVVVGARGTVISSRYLDPIDVSLVFAAGLALALADAPSLRELLADRIPRRGAVLAPLAAGALAALLIVPLWPTDRATTAAVERQVRLHANAKLAIAAIRANLTSHPTWRGLPQSTAISGNPLVIVPPRIRAQAVVDLQLPLTEVAYSYDVWFDPPMGKPEPGAIVYHDRRDDADDLAHAAVELAQPTVIGADLYVPLLANSARGMWVVKVEAAPNAGGAPSP